jgi:hypothetical protein
VSGRDQPRYAVVGGGAAVLLVIAVPLYREFSEPGQTIWNALLVLFLLGVAAGAFFLQRFFLSHAGEIGEARFDTRNKSDGNG